MKLKTLLLALAFVLLPVVSVHAEDGLTQCFDYYKFGSVQVDLLPQNKNVLAGTDLVFSGTVKNTNLYPIVGGAVYVKVFRRDSQSSIQSNGYELMDQFFAVRDMVVDGKKEAPLSFTWKVPAYAVGGEYTLATYFITQDKYNLAGLSFTDDITGSLVPFKVTSEQSKAVAFDKKSVSVDGQKFLFAAFNPKVAKDKEIKIDFSIKNSHSIAKNTSVKYTLYSWDGLQNQNIIESKTEAVTLKALESKKLSFTVKDNKHPVYYLVVESKTDDAKSIINVRFAREGIEKARLNFPSVAQYPLQSGTTTTMFACFHNSGLGEKVDNGKVVITLTDSFGQKLDSYTYTGEITGNMMAIKKSFIPEKDYYNFTLTAELFVDEKLVETSRIYYKCEKISDEACMAAADQSISASSRVMMYVVIIVALLSIIVSIFAYHGHMKRKDVIATMVLFVTVLGIGSYQVQAKVSSANILPEVTSHPIYSSPQNAVSGEYTYVNLNKLSITGKDDLISNGILQFSDSEAYAGIDMFQFKYQYGATMQYQDGTVIAKDAAVPVGSIIKFVPDQFDNTHIGWYLLGSTYDSPYGYWNDGTIPACQNQDKFADAIFPTDSERMSFRAGNSTYFVWKNRAYADLYFPVVADYPQVTINHEESTATLTSIGNGLYRVDGAGVIIADVNFDTTEATGYMQYEHTNRVVIPQVIDGVVQTTPTGQSYACTTLKSHQFSLDAKTITLRANATGVGNRPPNNPSLTLQGTCQNIQTNGNISVANPLDPDGDSIAGYDYQVDFGSGYTNSPIQRTTNIGFSVTFSTTGVKKIRVRAVDEHGAVSGWVERSTTIMNCDNLSVYCASPTFVGNNQPQWTASASSANSSVTYQYSWNWISRSYTNPSSNVLLSTNGMPPDSTMNGPSVTVNASNGLTQTVNCEQARRGGGGGTNNTNVDIVCTQRLGTNDRPLWAASIVGYSGQVTYLWSGASGSANGPGNNQFLSDQVYTGAEIIDGPTVTARDDEGTVLDTYACSGFGNGPSVTLTLSDVSGRKQNEVTVKQNQTAFAYTATNKIIPAQCIATKEKTSGATSNPLWGLTNVNFSDYDAPLNLGLASLNGYPLDTTVVGLFKLDVTCPELGNASNTETSSAILRVVVDPNLEEI